MYEYFKIFLMKEYLKLFSITVTSNRPEKVKVIRHCPSCFEQNLINHRKILKSGVVYNKNPFAECLKRVII